MNGDKFKMIRTLIVINELREAIIQLKKYSIADPDNYQALNLLGVVYEKEGDFECAKRMYSASLSLNPDYGPAQYNLDRLLRYNPDLPDPHLGGQWFHNLKTKNSEWNIEDREK